MPNELLIGFGMLHSPALQRQVSNFLLDASDRPTRFVTNDRLLKMGFRSIRADAFSEAPKRVVVGIHS